MDAAQHFYYAEQESCLGTLEKPERPRPISNAVI